MLGAITCSSYMLLHLFAPHEGAITLPHHEGALYPATGVSQSSHSSPQQSLLSMQECIQSCKGCKHKHFTGDCLCVLERMQDTSMFRHQGVHDCALTVFACACAASPQLLSGA